MARGRELSQLGSLITVDDSTKNIGVGIATPSQKIGIGTLSPTSKVEVVGDVFISGIITANTFSGDGSGLSNVPGTGGMSNVVEDTTPELGGSLDINGKDITGTGNINVSGVITATSFSGDGSGLTGVASTDNIQTATSANFLSNVNISGITTCQALTVSGDLTVDGTTTTINSTTLTVDDKTIVIASGAADSSAADGAGISIDGASATILYSHSGTKFVSNKPFEATSFTGDVSGNVTGNTSGSSGSCTGNAATATILQTARTIAGVSFDGSSNISLNNNAITNGAGYITSSGTAALAEGLTGTPDITVGVITATSFSGDGSSLTNITVSDATLSVGARSGGVNVVVAAGIVTVFGRSTDTEVSVAF